MSSMKEMLKQIVIDANNAGHSCAQCVAEVQLERAEGLLKRAKSVTLQADVLIFRLLLLLPHDCGKDAANAAYERERRDYFRGNI